MCLKRYPKTERRKKLNRKIMNGVQRVKIG